MAGSKSTVTGDDFYGPYDAQNYAAEMAPALGMQTVPSLNIVYTEEQGYVTADVSKEAGFHELKLSGINTFLTRCQVVLILGTKFRQMLRNGDEIPEWFAFKSVVRVLREEMEIYNQQNGN